MGFLTMLSPKLKHYLKKVWLRFPQSSTANAVARADPRAGLYEYDIASGKRARLARFPSSINGA
jgi:hypothetical protein